MNSMKLMPRRLGPYKVIRQFKNDVLVKHMATMEELEYHVDELLLFIGSEEEAKEAALLDNDMHYIDSYKTWTFQLVIELVQKFGLDRWTCYG